jgi:hypothetical protein
MLCAASGGCSEVARAGRKRRIDARRRATTREGRAPRDEGTPQLRAHRARLVGAAQSSDPRAAEPLGILAMAGILSAAQVDAGWRYAVLRWRLFGSPMPATRLYQRYLGGLVGPSAAVAATLSDTAERRLRDLFEEADAALRSAGDLAWRETRRVAVEQTLPDWFWRLRMAQPVVGDDALRAALQSGLAELAGHWRIGSVVRPGMSVQRSTR